MILMKVIKGIKREVYNYDQRCLKDERVKREIWIQNDLW